MTDQKMPKAQSIIRTRRHQLQAISLVAMLLMIFLAATFSAATPAPVGPDGVTENTTIENFGKVNQNYYRGSQPSAIEFEQLRQLGIKTVVDLRKDKEQQAAAWVTKAGMQYFNIPMKASVAATDQQAEYFLKLVNDPANLPVYVHCKGGRHRTGALTAVYRITHDGWNADQAFKEMKEYDFDSGFFGGPSAQKRFVFSFYERQQAARSGK